jgi:hypothetical protein
MGPAILRPELFCGGGGAGETPGEGRGDSLLSPQESAAAAGAGVGAGVRGGQEAGEGEGEGRAADGGDDGAEEYNHRSEKSEKKALLDSSSLDSLPELSGRPLPELTLVQLVQTSDCWLFYACCTCALGGGYFYTTNLHQVIN